ncbi:MAG: prephenate dehydrogenase/arogenate dehydrogenase family protein [Desulfovibrio sp.]|jgi:prephenate dehydrogenase|nr:prephenate dehydrogenase/arogenate dehydrogenase family protein [Desulfovibrio sp.]
MSLPPEGFPALCIVGSAGRMGAMLARRFALAGYPVSGLEAAPEEGGPERTARVLARSRLVLLCVPVFSLEEVLGVIAPHLGREHILLDITSVKTLPLRWMEAAFPGRVVGAHPLFGPAPEPEEMRVALVRGGRAEAEACREAELLFQRIGCATFWTTAQLHDLGVGLAQSLNFTASAAFFCALARHRDLELFLTPSLRRHLEAARKHLTVDRDMFCAFTAVNPEYPGLLKQYSSILEDAAAGGLERIAAEAALWCEAVP